MEFSREICVALPTHHALTGSDSTSFIHGIGKEKSYKIFEQDEVYTDAFSLLGEFEVVPPNVIDLLVQFICHLHNLPNTKISMKSIQKTQNQLNQKENQP